MLRCLRTGVDREALGKMLYRALRIVSYSLKRRDEGIVRLDGLLHAGVVRSSEARCEAEQ
jgi:hypothetical protein